MNTFAIEQPLTALITEGTVLKGEVTLSTGCQLQGIVEGNLLQSSVEPLEIGKSGWIHGEIISRGPVTVSGRVDGNITCEDIVILNPTARVQGKLLAPRIMVHAGAWVDGHIAVNAKPVKSSQRFAPIAIPHAA